MEPVPSWASQQAHSSAARCGSAIVATLVDSLRRKKTVQIPAGLRAAVLVVYHVDGSNRMTIPGDRTSRDFAGCSVQRQLPQKGWGNSVSGSLISGSTRGSSVGIGATTNPASSWSIPMQARRLAEAKSGPMP